VAPPALLAKAILLGLAIPVLLISREDSRTGSSTSSSCRRSMARALMVSADSFLTLFLGVELLSLPVYVLVLLAFRRPAKRGGRAQVPGARAGPRAPCF
jgi:NADH-quinone oxidoreductase subunit N